MKKVAIIQARMLSKRFRGKSLISLSGTPLLNRVIQKVQSTELFDEIIVATTELTADDPIISTSSESSVKTFRGSVEDVLKRFVDASSELDSKDIIVRYTADNPLYDVEFTKQIVNHHIDNGNEYTAIDGLSHIAPEVIQVNALRMANNLVTKTFDREHVTPYFRKNRDQFKVDVLAADSFGLKPEFDKYLTVDTYAQLEAVESMIDELGDDFNSSSIYEYLGKKYGVNDSAAKFAKLGNVRVGDGYPAFIMAEIGQNHNGSMESAKELIDMSVECGADAVKFQKRHVAGEFTKEAYERVYDNPNSFGVTYGEHREFLELDEKQHLELLEYANSKGISYFCTPCDVPSLELLERIGCPFYKVASRDLTNIPLLSALAKTGKSVIISTGMADLDDIQDAIDALSSSTADVIITQCTSQYPTPIENVNLKAMETIKNKFGKVVGLSDHTPGVICSVAASVLGAAVIEKHVTLLRSLKGTDHAASLERDGLRRLVEYIRISEKAMGDGEKFFMEDVSAAKNKLAKSVTSLVDIKKGEVISEEMLTLKCPGDGLKWRDRKQVIGKTASEDISKDVTIRTAMLS